MRKQLNKTGATSFNFEQLDIELKGNIFLPVQALNELRREGFEKLTEGILAKWERKAEAEEKGKKKRKVRAQKTHQNCLRRQNGNCPLQHSPPPKKSQICFPHSIP